MKRAKVKTSWVGAGTARDAFRPAVADTYTLRKWQDVTGDPRPTVSEIEVECEDAVLTAIKLDPAYGAPAVKGEAVVQVEKL